MASGLKIFSGNTLIFRCVGRVDVALFPAFYLSPHATLNELIIAQSLQKECSQSNVSGKWESGARECAMKGLLKDGMGDDIATKNGLRYSTLFDIIRKLEGQKCEHVDQKV